MTVEAAMGGRGVSVGFDKAKRWISVRDAETGREVISHRLTESAVLKTYPGGFVLGSRDFRFKEGHEESGQQLVNEVVAALETIGNRQVGAIDRPPLPEPVAAPTSTAPPAVNIHASGVRPMQGVERTTHRDIWNRASALAKFVEVGAYVVAGLVLLGGLVVAFQQDPVCDVGWSDCSFGQRYPQMVWGLSISVIGAWQVLVAAMLAVYVRARAADRL